ncbi:MAG: alpha/beta fold hydrolase [Rubrobacter sp.]|nr:alpha/beta fold hydrolase [Rubrobacter sp.]
MILPGYERGKLELDGGGAMPYVEFGSGGVELVFIPGAGDGLATAYDRARNLSWFYRKRALDFRMLVLSRREPIPEGYTVEQHAEDYAEALDTLGRRSVVLECNSAGGLIGQQVAVRRPDLVRGLVLASTAHRIDEQARAVISDWLELIERREWGEFAWDSSVKTYKALARRQWLKPVVKPLLGIFGRPDDPERLERTLRGLLGVDNGQILYRISQPALVFGGVEDPIFSHALQREMAEGIPDSRSVFQAGYLHGADLESPEYGTVLNDFVQRLGEER